jgi:hypothetical protein
LTIFEFLSVAASIVLALGLSTLITSIPFVFDASKRDWLHALANILGFTILMGTPLSLYLAATALVSNNPDKVENWREQFSHRSRWFFSALVGTWVFGILRGYVFLDRMAPWWSFLMLGGFVVAATSSRRDIHIGVLLMFVLAFAALIYYSFTATPL